MIADETEVNHPRDLFQCFAEDTSIPRARVRAVRVVGACSVDGVPRETFRENSFGFRELRVNVSSEGTSACLRAINICRSIAASRITGFSE